MLQVAPRSSMSGVVHGGGADPKCLGKTRGREGTLSDHQNVGSSELGVTASFTDRDSAASEGIGMVVGVGPCPQMCWLDTDRSVAAMQDVRLFAGNRIMEIEDSMRNDVSFSLPIVQAEFPVSIVPSGPGPVPTAFGGRLSRHEPPEYFSLIQPLRALVSLSPEGISVLAQPLIVRATEATEVDGISADRAAHIRIVEVS